MRQAIMTEPGKIVFNEVSTPKPGPNEVLFNIKRIGVCGSDVHVWHGKHPFTPYPVVQGHEYCGIVEAVGEDVEGVTPGMLATARPQLVCGKCGPCKRGDYNVCEKLKVQGFQAPGCAQDYFVTVPERFVALPDNLTLDQGAMVEPFAVGAHSTAKAGNLTDKNVIVFGAGMIGNVVAQFCLARSAKKLLITDISEYRLDVAKQCGMKNVSNPNDEKLEDAIKRVFGDEGFQVALEAAGAESALTAAVDNIEKGGRIVILGVFGTPPRINMAKVCEHELSVVGSMMYMHRDYLEAAEKIASGKVITDPLVTKHFAFEQYQDAYKFIDAEGDKTMKIMIDL
jgi:L-iditol 2-dehydrogenase/threonine 3-dehydrogenase